ncbi:MAG TPA: ATP-binding cassette domain-containing protein [Fodinibius sp.]|nr:ATP-binding cassette domain-containing protein [Fodinibius sp.]
MAADLSSKDIVISSCNLIVRFGSNTEIRFPEINVPAGKHTVIKGESGSGKSTLLKSVLGFIRPVSGTITFRERKADKSIRRQTAWLPQDLHLGQGRVKEIMAKPFQFAANKSRFVDDESCREILRNLGLGDEVFEKRLRDLSTGQRQRIGLGICYLLDKPILLLDEPTSALDKESKQKASRILLEHTNKTVLSTSHDPFWIEQADNIIELD